MQRALRCDQVGSLRRPDALLARRAAHRHGACTLEELRAAEDAAILDALARQRDTGIEILTDGEYRRDAWQTDLSDAVDGFVAEYPIVSQRLADGTTVELEMHTKAIVGKLRSRRRMTGHESSFLAAHAPGPFKITLPSPNSVVWGSFQPGLSEAAYPSRDALREDLIPIYQAELRALVEEGVRYVQFDEGFTRYGVEGWQDRLRADGIDPDAALATDIATENALYDAVDRDDVILASHLCRGSRTAARGRGGYDALAERLLPDLHVDRFLFEYDSDAVGGFDALRHLPPGKTVVLGLVTSKDPTLEDQDDLARRVEQAASFCPLEQLALSPQCGFGGSADNDFMSYERQFEKLANLVQAAQRVWS